MSNIIKKLSDSVIRKFTEILDTSWLQIESDTGWTDIKTINKTVPYRKFIITFENGIELECADNHILITSDYSEVFAKNSLGLKINSIYGPLEVISVVDTGIEEEMYDFSLADESNHLYYANGILSHNSTLMTIVAVWTAIFFNDQTIVIVANKQATAIEIFNRVRLAFIQMENWLKGGVVEFNKTFFTLANGSRILTSATSPDAIRGLSIDVLLLDEFAIIPPKDADDFWAAVTPTLATRFNNNPNAKLIVASTPKGVGNKFHSLVKNAQEGNNDFKIENAMWYDVPGRGPEFKEEEEKTLGPELFKQEYECVFLHSGTSPFDPMMFTKFEDEMKEPINILEDGCYKIWAKPSPDRIYSIGIDTSEGTGQDYSVAQIFDITNPIDIEQVAVYKTNKMDTITWANKMLAVCKQWYSPVVLIERTGPGTGPCDKFFESGYPRMVSHGWGEMGSIRNHRHWKPGIICNSMSKMYCARNMKYYINDRRCVKIYDEDTIKELRTFDYIKLPSGNYKWAAQNGFHDDHVMALGWSLFVLHDHVINQYFNVKERNGDGIVTKIEPKWIFNPKTDFEDTLYAELNATSPYIGAVVFRHGNNTGYVGAKNSTAKRSENRGDTLTYLLNHAQSEVSLQDYYNQQASQHRGPFRSIW